MPNPDLVSSLEKLCAAHDALSRHLPCAARRRRLRLDPRPRAQPARLGQGCPRRQRGRPLARSSNFCRAATRLPPRRPSRPKPDRLIIAVDCADQKRLGPVFDHGSALPDVNIDHHISNPGYAKLNLIDPDSPATAQVLYEIIAALKWPLTPEVAANLYVGLMTDTGCFRYRQTTARTFEVAARLVEAGADPDRPGRGLLPELPRRAPAAHARGAQRRPFRQPQPHRLVLPQPGNVRAQRRHPRRDGGADRISPGGARRSRSPSCSRRCRTA